MFLRTATFVVISALATSVFAADHADALKDFLTDDVAAVAYIDLSKVDAQAIAGWFDQFGMVPEEAKEELQKNLPKVQQRFDHYQQLGVKYAYALFRASDVEHKGVTWVVPVAEGGDAKAVMGLILSGRPDKFHVEHDMRPPFLPVKCEVVNGWVLGANDEEQLEMLKNKRPTEERDLSDAWKALGDGDLGLVIFGDADSRRVVREMFPELPKPFDAIDGELIADGLKWGGVKLTLPPKPEFELLVETTSENVAKTIDQAVQNVLSMVENMPQQEIPLAQKLRQALAEKLKPRVDSKRVQISLKDVAALASLARPPIEEVVAQARRSKLVNQFKYIGLAMHNYADKHKEFPARNVYGEDGKPLLSWRVLILPYLDEQELFNKFHLDEPWNSEHNLKLVTEMPAMYADPDPALSKLNRAGKTTFLLPASPGTVAGAEEPIWFNDITDGTSQTIMSVEVTPENAVTWTKPDDWEVDLDDPIKGVRRDDRDWFAAGFCDGSVHVFNFESISDENLRAYLTIAGGEVIGW